MALFRQATRENQSPEGWAFLVRLTSERQSTEAARNPHVAETPELVRRATELVGRMISTEAALNPFSQMEGGQRQFWLQRAADA